MLSELKRRRAFRTIPLAHQARQLRLTFWVGILGTSLLSYVLSGRLIFGFWGLLLGPLVSRVYVYFQEKKKAFEDEELLLQVFMALCGMTRSGLTLPHALGILGEGKGKGIVRDLTRYLKRFESGKPIYEVLHQFDKRSGLKFSGPSLTLMGLAYQQGIEISPLLEQVVISLQQDIHGEKQVQNLKSTVFWQACFALLLPWFLLLTLSYFQPQMVQQFFETGWGWGVGLMAIGLQVLGGVVLWRISYFR